MAFDGVDATLEHRGQGPYDTVKYIPVCSFYGNRPEIFVFEGGENRRGLVRREFLTFQMRRSEYRIFIVRPFENPYAADFFERRVKVHTEGAPGDALNLIDIVGELSDGVGKTLSIEVFTKCFIEVAGFGHRLGYTIK